MFPFKHTPLNAWSPLDADPHARFYTADVGGFTAAGSATRYRTGIVGTDTKAGAAHAAPDGQGFVELASGRMLLAGGAPDGNAESVVNTIWYSDDRGKTWAVLLADGDHPSWSNGVNGTSTHSTSTARPEPAHNFGFFTLTISGVEWVYWLGGDPFLPTGNVFRSSDGGSTWASYSTTCPTSGLALYMYGTIGTDIYVLGGQTEIADTNTVSKKVYKSTDYGASWAPLDAGHDCPAAVYGTQLGPLPLMDGYLWVAGSGRYHSSAKHFSNAVCKFDGTTWTTMLTDGHAQFPKSRYHSCVRFNGKLWRFNGTTWDGVTLDGDTVSAHYSSSDGATWTEWTDPLPWGQCHAGAALASTDGLYLGTGFESSNMYVIREYTGSLVSAWTDKGMGARRSRSRSTPRSRSTSRTPSVLAAGSSSRARNSFSSQRRSS